MWFVPRAQLTLLAPEANAATYTFNKHVIRHRFCPNCGIHVYGEAPDPKGNLFAVIQLFQNIAAHHKTPFAMRHGNMHGCDAR